jgi:hypothetical protein
MGGMPRPSVPPLPPPSWQQVVLWGLALLAGLGFAIMWNLAPVAMCATGAPYDPAMCELNEHERAKQRSKRLRHAAAWTALALALVAAALFARHRQLDKWAFDARVAAIVARRGVPAQPLTTAAPLAVAPAGAAATSLLQQRLTAVPLKTVATALPVVQRAIARSLPAAVMPRVPGAPSRLPPPSLPPSLSPRRAQ